MAERDTAALSGLITKHEAELLTAWIRNQLDAGSLGSGQIKEDELQDQSRRFLRDFAVALKSGEVDEHYWTGVDPNPGFARLDLTLACPAGLHSFGDRYLSFSR